MAKTPLPPSPFLSGADLPRVRKAFDEAALLAAVEADVQAPQFLSSPRPEYLRALPHVPAVIAELLARY